MKKIKIGLIILSIVLNIGIVKADTIIDITYGGQDPKSELWYLNNLNWNKWKYENNTTNNCNSREDCYNQAITYFNSLNYQYYSMYINIYPTQGNIELVLLAFNFNENEEMNQTVYSSGGNNITRYRFYKTENGNDINTAIILDGYSDPNYNNFYELYDSNYSFINSGDYIFRGFYDNEGTENYDKMLKIANNGTVPKIKDLMLYNSWSDYENNHLEGYTEIDLDNYKYVLLTLKNYNQTQAFQTNLQVKGQIGITPIYNYGQTSKDAITGVQVQDRCNVSYESYTSYPFYILQTDLQNNVVYAVKECSQGSSFKFDNSIFNVTYVTAENEESPTVTINGKTYDVIPYDDLPSTATKNEEDNYIPGESGSATDTGGLDSAIAGAQSKLSEIWNTITYFTSFIGLIFSSLPSEVHTILLSAFTIMIVLGIIKIFLGK